jgi:hypothetical protein
MFIVDASCRLLAWANGHFKEHETRRVSCNAETEDELQLHNEVCVKLSKSRLHILDKNVAMNVLCRLIHSEYLSALLMCSQKD